MESIPSKEKIVGDAEEYKVFAHDFDYYISFLSNLADLISYNGRIIALITNKGCYQLDTSLLNCAIQTLKNIKACCSIGGFSDANTLIRKFRDDLLLYIFILDIINRRNPFAEGCAMKLDYNDADNFVESFLNLRLSDVLTEDEKAVEAWFCNSVEDLPFAIKKKLAFGNYMAVLRENKNIHKILEVYKLEDYWEKLRVRLNGYVHNNGKQFTLQNFIPANDKNTTIHLSNINYRVSYVTAFFLALLLMVDSSLIASTDLIDHLDCNMTPPDDCQYLVANFVQDFIDAKIIKIHPELKQYLKENNIHGMKIE